METWYIKQTLAAGVAPIAFGRQEFLPPPVIFGLIFGYIVGQRWWHMVYVEKRCWGRWKK